MRDYEILSRATTFLLAVDPKEAPSNSKYAWLEENVKEREALAHKQDYAYEPAGGPRREAKDLGWLEFCPKNFRPVVHCVAASHVIAPWKWGNYYTQEWLTKVKPEHWYVCDQCDYGVVCSIRWMGTHFFFGSSVYSLEVYDPEKPQEALAKFALNPYPIHHPEGRDLALIHLKQEEESKCVGESRSGEIMLSLRY
jgi:hypothetical protein